MESIGHAVTVTDVDGHITMMNAVAERLTGWPAAVAIGKSLRAVFHVVDEQNRKDVIERTGDSGRNPFVVHLPERSVLVSKKEL